MEIQLIALDMDDTLLDKSIRISPRTKEAIRQAARVGVTVTIATGRMFCSARPFAEELGIDVPLITYNGALVKRVQSGEVLLHRPLDEAVAARILALFRENGWYIQSYIDDTLYVAEHNDKAQYYEQLAGVTATVLGDRLYTQGGAPTKLLAMGEPAELKKVEKLLAATFGSSIYMASSKPNYLEITHPEVNKGKALALLGGLLGIRREAIMAIGDSRNDLDMLEYAGWGVAMGNASDTVKAAADAVTGANDADGVAEAINKYVLGNR